MLHIVTDGTADFPPGWIEKYQIEVIPFHIHFGDEGFLQNVDLDEEGFYRLIAERRIIPKTSQLSPRQLEETYIRIADPGDVVLSIHVGSKLSGTYESAIAAARKLAGRLTIVPFDSAAGAAALAFMCKEAREMDRRGLPIEAILRRLETIRKTVRVLLTIDTLEYARMSGRVKAIQAMLASLLQLKPIVELKNGELVATGKVRSRVKALHHVVHRMAAEMKGQRVDVAIVHARAPEDARRLAEMAQKALNVRELVTTALSIAVTVHLGPRTAGLVAYPVEVGHATLG